MLDIFVSDIFSFLLKALGLFFYWVFFRLYMYARIRLQKVKWLIFHIFYLSQDFMSRVSYARLYIYIYDVIGD